MAENSLIAKMARAYEMDPVVFEETLSRTIIKNDKATKEQLNVFLIVADEYGLNPFTREIYAFPDKSGGIQPVVSVDGWLKLINQHPQFNGMEFVDEKTASGDIVSITCLIHRKDREYPTVVTEYMEECKRGTEPWNKWGRRMLRHKATIQAARYALGFSGITDQDEAERMLEMGAIQRVVDNPAVLMPAKKTEKTIEETLADSETITQAQQKVLRKMLGSHSVDDGSFCLNFEIGAVELLPSSKINDALKWVQSQKVEGK